MLKELETLSRNISKLITLNQHYCSERLTLKEEVTKLSIEVNVVREELEQLYNERETLISERDILSSMIDDARVKLNMILNKLSISKSHAELKKINEKLELSTKIPSN